MRGGKILDKIIIELRDRSTGNLLPVYIDIFDNSLSRKWIQAAKKLLDEQYHLEKNYCFFGFADGDRDGRFLVDNINTSIRAINASDLGYHINDIFTIENCLNEDRTIVHDKFNRLHRYFEDLQGVSGRISPYAQSASAKVKWHIRQLNLLCHEFESWALSYRKQITAPEWQRPSQLMCWLNAPRFLLDEADYELFGIDTINRPLGGVFVGVNKAVGKHHWEVYHDEGRNSRISELTTSTMRSQTEAAGDFDIEWGVDPRNRPWQIQDLANFRQWLTDNGFDPDDPGLTIGHPQIGQVDLDKTFGNQDHFFIWSVLSKYTDVYSVSIGGSKSIYNYHWSDLDFIDKQISIINKGN